MRGARPLTVFLSYSVQDSRAAAKLRDALKKAGLEVLDQTCIDSADSTADAVRRLIAQADAVLAIVGDNEISPWVRDELGAALSWDKPAIALLWPEASAAGIPAEVRTVRVDASGLDPSRITELLQTATRD